MKRKKPTKQKTFGMVLLEAKKVLDKLGIRFWLACGTALGYYRGKKFIEHDRDIDIAIMIKDYSDEIKKGLKEDGFRFVHQYGTVDNGLEMSFRLTRGPKLDIFFIYEEDYCYWRSFYSADSWGDVRAGKEIPKQYMTKFTKFNLIEVDFLKTQFLIPEVGYIEELYGDNWRVPDENYISPNAILAPKLDELGFFNINKDWINNITIGIKTFLRPICLENCLKSIRLYYPGVNIIIADDSNDDIKTRNKAIAENYNATSLDLDFDVGISVGRNVILDNVSTKYLVIVDDDIFFTHQTDIKKMYDFLEETEYDIIGGCLDGRGMYEARFDRYTLEPKEIHYYEQHYGPVYNSSIEAYRSDRCMNCFMGNTLSLKKVRWTDKLKLHEHTTFFVNAWIKGLRTAVSKEIVFDEKKVNSREYRKYRGRGEYFFNLRKEEGDFMMVKIE